MDKELQLSELEMLESMFPNKLRFDEPELMGILKSDCFSLDDVQISFCLPICFTDKEIILSTTYPSNYPSEKKMEVHLRSDHFDRESQSRINLDLTQYLNNNFEVGDLFMGVAVSWIQENGESYFTKEKTATQNASSKTSLELSYSRLWVYSHHLYSKIKRKDILDLSKDFQVNGFSLPGKPGIICLEGQRVDDMWNIIKSWNWKKIGIKIRESPKADEDEKSFCKFKDFKEINFLKSDQTRDYHMDFGEFRKFLSDHGLEYIFKEIVGLK